MLVKTYAAAVNGLQVNTVTVETSVETGQQLILTGLGDEAVRESQSRIRVALKYCNLRFPSRSITINLSPANLRKEGSGFDLPMAIALLAGDEKLPPDHLEEYMMMGELGLDGSLKPIIGALPIAIKAREEGFKGIILPKENSHEAAVVNNLDVYGMTSLTEVIQFLSGNDNDNGNGNGKFRPLVIDTRKIFYEQQYNFDLDFADVKGQENVKRALEVAAAGGHNMIMIGPPGSGKSMMAKRLPSILPPLSLAESLETTKIYSVAGKMAPGQSLISQRPFRSPHHTITQTALVGGGTNPSPGEISLAHNGVLFADELPEFNKQTLEVLRQPLEDRKITIARAKYTTDYPCSFMFVASANPCPCGYYGDPTHDCICTPGQRARYMSKISGPLMDRIDIQCEITPVPFKDPSQVKEGEPSSAIRERVIRARKIQEERFANETLRYDTRASSLRYGASSSYDTAQAPTIRPAGYDNGNDNGNVKERIHCNAQMTEKMIHKYAKPDEEGMEMLRKAMERFSLSARAYSRILKVARTIADLDGSEQVKSQHIAEAIGYRMLDRGDWAER
ncbi:MAG: YifB family Mg chelatase-like AAA ATPase [Prevotella sp.]|nr:YifB family Mg chelatase-like AAA ATPase [Prevotella sp.]